MIPLPDEVTALLDGRPRIGQLDQAFPLLTVDPDGVVDVCLLSRTELEPSGDSVRIVMMSRKARRNLVASGRATLVAVAGNAAHYLALELRRYLESEGAMAAELALTRHLRDDLGVELHPVRFRAEARLQVEERWDRTAILLGRLREGGGRTV